MMEVVNMENLGLGNLFFMLIMIGVVVIGLFVIGFIFVCLYIWVIKEIVFVCIGLGGEKVIKDGGVLVLLVVYEVILVNMNILCIEVEKIFKDVLIIKDCMCVDVKVDFYLWVVFNVVGIFMVV